MKDETRDQGRNVEENSAEEGQIGVEGAEAADMAPSEEEITEAVRRLRLAYNETQQQFALRINATLRTVTRYETNRRPHGTVLLRLWALAKRKSLVAVADVFRRAYLPTMLEELTGGGFEDFLYEQFKPKLWAKVTADLEEKVIARIRAEGVIGGALPELSEDERKFLVDALQAYRTADPQQRALMGDVEGLLRRARWMKDLEDKIRITQTQ